MTKLLLSLLALSLPAFAADRYEKRADHDRDGIGVFYMGREIAHVMGHLGADWLERPERQQEERTDLLIDALKLKPGDMVADIGAGTGYIAEKMARRILPGGVVYGVEIQQEMLDLMAQKMKFLKVDNVKGQLGTITDPKLAEGTIDLIIMVDVYHEFDHPYEMTEAMVKSLKKGGRLVFVEYRKEDPKVAIKLVHKMTEAQVKKEMAEFSQLEWAETNPVLPQQHIIVFRKK